MLPECRDFIYTGKLFSKGICHKEASCNPKDYLLYDGFDPCHEITSFVLTVPQCPIPGTCSGLSTAPFVQDNIVRSEKYAPEATRPLLLFHS